MSVIPHCVSECLRWWTSVCIRPPVIIGEGTAEEALRPVLQQTPSEPAFQGAREVVTGLEDPKDPVRQVRGAPASLDDDIHRAENTLR